MRGALSVWVDLARSVGRALLELLGAEVTALSDELKGSARQALAALVLLVAAAFLAFWALGLAAWTAVEALALVLPRWGAALTVLGAVTLATLVLLLVARARLRRLETPVATVRRHVDEHAEWWRQRVLEEPAAGEIEPGVEP